MIIFEGFLKKALPKHKFFMIFFALFPNAYED